MTAIHDAIVARMANGRIVFSIPGMENGARETDLIYKTVGADQLLADLYLPAPSDKPPPVVALIHGALPPGFDGKGHPHFVSWGQLIAASGMAALAFNHRARWMGAYVPETLPQAAYDLADAVAYLRANAARFKLDASRICLFAFSAGGPLLAAPLRERWPNIRCVVAFYAVLGEPLPGSADAGRFSALAGLADGAKPPPTFLVKAGMDAMPLINYSLDQFANAARALGDEVRLEEHPTGVHAFDALNDDDTSRAIIRDALAFMRLHLH
jgi:acetyl esterase/lipase